MSTDILLELECIHNNNKFTIPVELYSDNKYNSNRRNIILLIAEILQQNNEFKLLSYSDQCNIVILIEKSCYDKTIQKSNEDMIYINWENPKFVYLYQLIISRITKNLDCNSEVNSEYLIDNIINKSINIDNIASMSSEELSPGKVLSIKQTLELRRNQKLNYKTTSLYTCRHCKSKKCTMRTQQMRSLDEGFTIILNCTVCGFRFLTAG